MTKKIQSIPEARLLLESLRSVGYNEETAIADIIDIVFAMKMYALRFSIKTSITMLNLLSIFLASALDRKIRLQNRCLIVSEI